MENEYASDLFIDDSALDVEWLDQPSLMLKYTGIQALKRKEVDRLKEDLAIIKAELDKKIRSNPDAYGIDKITENVIFNTIITQKKYKRVQVELIEAQYEYQMSSGAVSAVEQRKSALENLSKLLGLNYFSGPNVPRVLNNEVAKKQKDISANKKIKIKR